MYPPNGEGGVELFKEKLTEYDLKQSQDVTEEDLWTLPPAKDSSSDSEPTKWGSMFLLPWKKDSTSITSRIKEKKHLHSIDKYQIKSSPSGDKVDRSFMNLYDKLSFPVAHKGMTEFVPNLQFCDNALLDEDFYPIASKISERLMRHDDMIMDCFRNLKFYKESYDGLFKGRIFPRQSQHDTSLNKLLNLCVTYMKENSDLYNLLNDFVGPSRTISPLTHDCPCKNRFLDVIDDESNEMHHNIIYLHKSVKKYLAKSRLERI